MTNTQYASDFNQLLLSAEKENYAVGAFSARYSTFIRPILQAAQLTKSPAIVQISEKEISRYGVDLVAFSDLFNSEMERQKITVPIGLHLDHTKKINLIKKAISVGFSSVMIDASDLILDENIRKTQEVVEYATRFGVAVEGELGRIASANLIETDSDEELFTRPDEARRFVDETGVDALAVSVGTAHGIYKVRQPKIDLNRLLSIREQTPVHLVLHGGSGTPPEMIKAAIKIQGGGVSKVNIATSIELAALSALGLENSITNLEMKGLPGPQLDLMQTAVKEIVMDKIINFLGSNGFGV